MGGKGSVVGTILGAIILGAMRNGLTLLNVQAFYQLLATGLIIIVAMLVDRRDSGAGMNAEHGYVHPTGPSVRASG